MRDQLSAFALVACCRERTFGASVPLQHVRGSIVRSQQSFFVLVCSGAVLVERLWPAWDWTALLVLRFERTSTAIPMMTHGRLLCGSHESGGLGSERQTSLQLSAML